MDPIKHAEIDAEVQHLLWQGRIVPSSGKWSSPIVAVQKLDGSIWLCIDYWKVNDITMQDMYPLPHMDDLVNGIGQPTINYLSSINVKSSYHQIPVATGSQDKTAFIYPGGFYKYLYMPFGIKNAPVVFQCFMDKLLQEVAGKHIGT